jgi:hypothetical protein
MFFFDVVGFMFWWIWLMPYFLGLLASMDRTGRLAAFSSAMQSTGLSLGQVISAFVVAASPLSRSIHIGISLAAVALITTIAAVRLHRPAV